MGKRLIQQRRGRLRGRYKSPSHKNKGDVKYTWDIKDTTGVVEDIFHDPGHTAPIAKIRLNDNRLTNIIAPENLKIGDKIKFTSGKDTIKIGNVLTLGNIPEGTPIYNIELSPGDGGKLVRAGGTTSTVVSHYKTKTVIRLPSGSFKTINSDCKATIGVSAGGGRKDKPFVKAGKKHHAFRKKGRVYPVVRGVAMNPVSHPHGGGGHQHVGKPSTVKRGAPPGRKVGSVAAKRSGRK